MQTYAVYSDLNFNWEEFLKGNDRLSDKKTGGWDILKEDASLCDKALATIRVSNDKLPANDSRDNIIKRQQIILRRQRLARNNRIYLDWLKSDDKESVLDTLSEKWGLRKGAILRIIDQVRSEGVAIGEEAVKARAIRELKAQSILTDAAEMQFGIDQLLYKAMEMKRSGINWIEVEELETVGRSIYSKSQDGMVELPPEIKTKRVSVDDRIIYLYKTKVGLYGEEAKTLNYYLEKPSDDDGKLGLSLELKVSQEFKDMFNKFGGKENDKENPIDVDFVDVSNVG